MPVRVPRISIWPSKIRACKYPRDAERLFHKIPKRSKYKPYAFLKWVHLCVHTKKGNLRGIRKICDLIETEEKFKELGMNRWSTVPLRSQWGTPTWKHLSQHLQETLIAMKSDRD